MESVYQRQTQLMDRSGLGLLPGIALAFLIALLLIAAITLHTWWSVAIALAGVFGGTAIVLFVVVKTVMADDGEDATES